MAEKQKSQKHIFASSARTTHAILQISICNLTKVMAEKQKSQKRFFASSARLTRTILNLTIFPDSPPIKT
jgi:hypothetical protein